MLDVKKLTNKLNKFQEILKKNFPFLCVFAILFLLFFFQHSMIAMYYDDFGNASLSYNMSSANIIGTNYSLVDLWNWCKITYTSWGGRILYASVFLIPMLKYGITLYMFAQSIVLTLILYFIYKIVALITNHKNLLIPLILFVLYSLINMVFLRHGIYWASASILYIWPLLPLFAFVYFYLKLTKKIEEGKTVNYVFWLPVLLILNFFATFSQEQLGVATLAFLLVYIFFCHRKEMKKYFTLDIPNLVVCVVSFLFLIGAPGNWARMDSNVEFASLSLFGKICYNFPEIIRNIFNSEMQIYMIMLTILFLGCLILKRKQLFKNEWVVLISQLSFVLFTFLCLLFQKVWSNTVVIYGVIWIIYIGIWMIIYGLRFHKLSIPTIAIAGCGSIFCLLVSPTQGGRTSLPFLFFIFLLIAIFINELFHENKLYLNVILVLALLFFSYKGAFNYYRIYRGYAENYALERLNFDLLRHYNSEEDGKTITLYKYKETWYGTFRSYEEPSMDYWIKEYFAIPQDVEFQWVDIYKPLR